MEHNQPKNYLVESILVTICCCLPLGIVGIVYASQVNSKFAAGDIQGAQLASAESKKWMTWGIIAGVIINVGFFLLYGVAMLAILSDSF